MTFPKVKYYGQLKDKTNVEIFLKLDINHDYGNSSEINVYFDFEFRKQVYQDSIRKSK